LFVLGGTRPERPLLYALLCYHDEAVVTSRPKEEDDAVIAKRRKVTDPLAAGGKLAAVIRLMPTTAATTLRMGRDPVVLDGPFAETKEALLGLYIVDCPSLENAIELARQIGREEKVVFEIRPVRRFEPQGKTA
jgi:hypothetical protein